MGIFKCPRRSDGLPRDRFIGRVEVLENRLPLTGVWDGGGDGVLWNNPLNWDDDQVPPPGSDIVFDLPEEYEVIVEFNEINVANLTMQSPGVRLVVIDSGIFVLGETRIEAGMLVLQNGNLMSNRPLQNHAEITVAGFSSIEAPVLQNGLVRVEPDSQLFVFGGGFDGGGQSAPFLNLGVIELSSGAQLLLENRSFDNIDGVLRGDGQILVRQADLIGGEFPNIAEFDLSRAIVSSKAGRETGILAINGDMHMNGNSSMEIDIAGPVAGVDHDQLLIEGIANLDGFFDINFLNGFQPSVCDRFTVVRSLHPIMGFPSFGAMNLGNGLVLRPVFEGNQISLVAVNPAIAINYSVATPFDDSGTAQYQVCLSTQPTSDVQIQTSVIGNVDVDPPQLAFGSFTDDWQTVRTVNVFDQTDVQPDDGSFVITHFSMSDDPLFSSEANPFLTSNVLVTVAGRAPIPEDNFESDEAIGLQFRDLTIEGLTIHEPGNDDLFSWEAPTRGIFAVDTFFDAELGEIDLEVYDENFNLIDWSATRTDHEHVSIPVVPNQVLIIRVFGFDDAVHPDYDLVVRLNPERPQIYVSGDQEIRYFDEQGVPLGTIEHELFDAGTLGDLEIGSGNLVYVFLEQEEQKSILEFTAGGSFSRQFLLPEDAAPSELEFNGFDVVRDSTFLIGSANNEVLRISLESEIVERSATASEIADAVVLSNGNIVPSNAPNGAAFINGTFEGNAWVAFPNDNNITLQDPFGSPLSSIAFGPDEMPIDALETDDRRVIVASRSAGGGGKLFRYDLDTQTAAATVLDMSVNGLAVSDFETPSRIPKPDQDGDGLLDEWETDGLDINDDGIIDLDLPALGADPLYKDLFVEVDAMSGRAPNGLNQPIPVVEDRGLTTGTVLDRVVESFVNAPVPNPNGESGINLHILIDETNLPLSAFTTRWGEFDAIKEGTQDTSGHFATSQERARLNWTAIREAKKHVFRYSLFADRIGELGVSGVGEVPGNDFLITLGNFDTPGGTSDDQTGTFLHELGHTLGLKHGGHDTVNFKPNYQSVMNYHWQFRHQENNAWVLDFSPQRIEALDELALDESVGIGFDPPVGVEERIVQAGPLPFRSVPLSGPADWNRNGQIDAQFLEQDINRGLADTNGDGLVNLLDESPGQFLRGHNDWMNLRYLFTDLQNFREFRDGNIDRPEEPDGDPTPLYDPNPPDSAEPNDEMDEAEELDFIETLTGLTIHAVDDVDWFQLVIEFAGELIVGAEILGTTATFLEITVFDQLGNLLSMLDVEKGRAFESYRTSVEMGDVFFVKINPKPGSELGRYNLLLNPGEANENHTYDAGDIDTYCEFFRDDEYEFYLDLNQDSFIDRSDIEFLLKSVLGTVRGDSDLDGVFNSDDLIRIFQAGEYEDGIPRNSTWASGDWDCDQEFGTNDLIVAFQDGGYTSEAVKATAVEKSSDWRLRAAIDDSLPDDVEWLSIEKAANCPSVMPNGRAKTLDAIACDAVFLVGPN